MNNENIKSVLEDALDWIEMGHGEPQCVPLNAEEIRYLLDLISKDNKENKAGNK